MLWEYTPLFGYGNLFTLCAGTAVVKRYSSSNTRCKKYRLDESNSIPKEGTHRKIEALQALGPSGLPF
jgi:hypothetical protein